MAGRFALALSALAACASLAALVFAVAAFSDEPVEADPLGSPTPGPCERLEMVGGAFGTDYARRLLVGEETGDDVRNAVQQLAGECLEIR